MPSSNVKLFTLYAGMKYLGDSLKGLAYAENDSSIFIRATGDPTFLYPDFISQPVFSFLNTTKKRVFYDPSDDRFWERAYGAGWSWDDYAEDFMAERSLFPVYGNLITYFRKNYRTQPVPAISERIYTNFPDNHNIKNSFIKRNFNSNNYTERSHLLRKSDSVKIPFITSDTLPIKLLSDTLHKPILQLFNSDYLPKELFTNKLKTIYSRPVDSLFKPMMFNSDNFFAEQTLLMVSNEKLSYMSDEMIIDSLLKNDFKNIPTKPRWVDGSGLSRYNLFSPKDFIYILNKLKDSFGLDRMKRILPGAGKGTLTNYYGDIAGSIFAKTGSMSNNVSLSGYLITKKKRLLLFSVIINNFSGSGKAGRRAIEQLLLDIREKN